MTQPQRLQRVLPVAAAAAVLLTGCGQQHHQSPRPLDTDEAQALAIMRFNNYSKHFVHATFSITTPTQELQAKAVLNMRRGVGYGEYTTVDPSTKAPLNNGMLAWNASLIEVTDGGDFTHPPKATAWTTRSLTRTNATDILFVLGLDLAEDRPENPALLQQSGARLLRTAGSGAKAVYVIAGPGSSTADTGASASSPASASAAPPGSAGPSANASTGSGKPRTTYWVDKSGHLEKFVANLGGDLGTIRIVDGAGYPKKVPKVVYRYLRMSS